jgi:hypothetical protein
MMVFSLMRNFCVFTYYAMNMGMNLSLVSRWGFHLIDGSAIVSGFLLFVRMLVSAQRTSR